MRSSLLAWILLIGFVAPAALTTPVYAEEEAEEDDEFETEWFGARIGLWYRPEFDMNVQIGGDGLPNGQLFNAVFPSDINIQRDLGVNSNPRSTVDWVDFDDEVILDLEIFFTTRLFSVTLGWTTPFEYRGQRTLFNDISFGGITFPAQAAVESRFEQQMGRAEFAINIIDNKWVRISPFVALGALAIDWEIELSVTAGGLVQGTRADTSDIDSPLEFGDDQVLPYPELGIDVAVGYRELIEFRLKLGGAYVDYFGYEGGIYRAELTGTVYPIPYLGVYVGGRYFEWDLKSGTENNNELFNFNLEYLGAIGGIVVRI